MRTKNRRLLALGTIACISILMVGAELSPALATTQTKSPSPAEVSPKMPERTTVSVPFPSTTRLLDAVKLREYSGFPVKAYQIANPEITGEFALDGALTPDEFLKTFDDMYGTQPMIAGAVVEVPTADLESTVNKLTSDAETRTFTSGFVADPVPAEKASQLFPDDRQTRSQDQSKTLAAPTGWKPEYAGINVIRPTSSTVRFDQYFSWQGNGNNTNQLPVEYGLEFQVDIYTANPNFQVDHRPNCQQGYKEAPFAKNYGWTWTASVNVGNGLQTMPNGGGVYADYNDLLDECKKSSIALGMRKPQTIPSYPNGAQQVLFSIIAPRGIDNTGEISGAVQSIDNTYCDLNPLLSLTDCMGVLQQTNGERLTLNRNNHWIAPNKCWDSFNQGTTAAVAVAC